ncbi:MAG: ABC transporter substrate-binding protein [Verrucomicrobia bacterium]|nr:ABC transporter substrate-binding protein [Verrucomicrobiota bacterium]
MLAPEKTGSKIAGVHLWWQGIGWVLAALLAAGCARPEPKAEAGSAGAQRRRVVLQSDWFPQAEHGGYYQALARGYYAEAGLELEIWPGGPGAGIKLKVVRGDADFGMQRSDDVLVAASRGLPLVMVAATLQHDALALMVHANDPVRTVGDLQSRVVIGNVGMAWMPYLERRFGITFEKRQNTYGLGEFLANPATIQQCMVTNEPFFAQRHGRPVRTLPLAEAGYDCYHVVVTRRELARAEPGMVRAFVAASIRGWRDYLAGDPGPAHAEILRRNPEMTRELLEFSRTELKRGRYVEGRAGPGDAIGRLSFARLQEQLTQLRELGILETAVPLAEVASVEFLPPVPAGH